MRRIIFIVLFSFLTLIAADTLVIDSVTIIIPTKDNFTLNVGVTVTESIPPNPEESPRFIYNYTLINSENSVQPIHLFDIPWFPSPPAVPFEIEKIDTVIAPPGPRKVVVRGRPSWFTGLQPGDSVSGFIVITSQLPYPTDWYAVGYDTTFGPAIYGGPPYIGESEWIQDTLKKIYYKQTPYGPGKTGKTVGPGPEVPFPAIVAVESLEVLLDRCLEIGWITDQKTRDHLWRILRRVKGHLNAGRLEQAKKANQQFMDWVLKKREDQQHGTIKFEGYYVLYYRSKYLFSGTGGGGGPEE